MSCNPRRGVCPGGGLTKTQQLRQAKTAALMKDLEKKREETLKRQQDPFSRRKPKSTYEPKKVDFSKPTMTKTMMARMKHAEKFKQEYESKKEFSTNRQPKRTPAPIGGDARVGREKIPAKDTRCSRPVSAATSPKRTMPRKVGTAGPSCLAPPAQRGAKSLKSADKSIGKKTNELARMMNADIVQAEPIGTGPISNIVIPPGMVNDGRTTIVSITQPAGDADARQSSVANRSIQVISETLDEQDAAEVATVQNRLTELQQARREFVIAVANVGGNAVGLEETARPPSPPKPVQRSPPKRYDVGALKPVYGMDHPDIQAAREHIQRTLAEKEAQKAAQRMEEEFERIAMEDFDDLNLDVPFEEELYQDRDISWEEDEETGMAMPCASRVKAYTEPVPKQQQAYEYDTFDPEELERFFDLKRYPPCPRCGPPEGRENLHPDLWDLDDPWYKAPPMPDDPDLIEFDR